MLFEGTVWDFMLVFVSFLAIYIFLLVFVVFACCFGWVLGAEPVRARRIRASAFKIF